MSEFTVQIEQIQFKRDEKRGEDGAVWYLILSPCEECRTNPGHHVCATHPGMTHHYERQAFRCGSFGHRLDATQAEIADDRANVWGWDSNREAPTLTPSYLAFDVKNGKTLRPYRMHSFLTAGHIQLCGDSTVSLHPNPQACVDRPRRAKPRRRRKASGTMIGRRRYDKDWSTWSDLQPGDYSHLPTKTASGETEDLWAIVTPDGRYCHISAKVHTITEHEDGTITVSPSILRHATGAGDPGWHEYLERGVWRSC